MEGHKWQIKAVGEAFTDLLDTFSGGANDRFVPFLFLIREMDRRAADGDVDAFKILDILLQLHKLINTAVKLDRKARQEVR